MKSMKYTHASYYKRPNNQGWALRVESEIEPSIDQEVIVHRSEGGYQSRTISGVIGRLVRGVWLCDFVRQRDIIVENPEKIQINTPEVLFNSEYAQRLQNYGHESCAGTYFRDKDGRWFIRVNMHQKPRIGSIILVKRDDGALHKRIITSHVRRFKKMWLCEFACAKVPFKSPSEAEIEAAKTKGGSWTKKTLARWGVGWPPPKGWKGELIAKSRSS